METNKIRERYDKLVSIRNRMVGYWRDIEQYCMAGVNPYMKEVTIAKPNVYDGTAFRASSLLSSSLYSSFTNPASNWYNLQGVQNTGKGLKDWLVKAKKVMDYVLYNSNFYTMVSTFYYDLIHYGVACIYEEYDPRNAVRFTVINPNNFVWSEDNFGNITEVFVDFEMTPLEAVEAFGTKNLPEKIIKALENDKKDKFKFYSYTSKILDTRNKFEYQTIYLEKETNKVVDIIYHYTMPYFIVRWEKKSGFLYGSSPSLVALPDVKQLNAIVKDVVMGAELAVNPAFSLPYDGYLEPVTLEPGGLNYRLTSDPKDVMMPISNGSNVNVGLDMIQFYQQKVNEAYYVDLFLLPQEGKTPMTATEVMQRAQEKMLLLGSVVGRLTHEFLSPLLRRTLAILMIYNYLDNPYNLNVYDFEIEYLSPLAQSQKAGEFASIMQVLNVATLIGQFNPQVFDNVNWDLVIREIGDIYAVPSTLFVDPVDMANMRQQRAEAQAQAQQLQMEMIASKVQKQQASAQREAVKAQLGR